MLQVFFQVGRILHSVLIWIQVEGTLRDICGAGTTFKFNCSAGLWPQLQPETCLTCGLHSKKKAFQQQSVSFPPFCIIRRHFRQKFGKTVWSPICFALLATALDCPGFPWIAIDCHRLPWIARLGEGGGLLQHFTFLLVGPFSKY